MTINELAVLLLNDFSPEERSIPDDADFPNRNVEVLKAINSGLQEVFGEGSPWLRHDERGFLVHAPTTITISVTDESDAAEITAGFESWMLGCTFSLDGKDNKIKAIDAAGYASLTVNPDGTNNTFTLTARQIGASGNAITFEIAAAEFIPALTVGVSETDITITPVQAIAIGGSMTSDGTTAVTFPPLYVAGTNQWTSDGNETAPTSGNWYEYAKQVGTWVARKFVNGTEVAFWESTFADPQQTDPLDPTIDLQGAIPATGTPTVSAITTTTAAQVIAAMNADAYCHALVSATASGVVTGTVDTVAQTPLAGGSNAVTLKTPYSGTTGSKTATVYQNCIAIPDAIMEVCEPVAFSGRRIFPITTSGPEYERRRSSDYGMSGFSYEPPSIEDVIATASTPVAYAVETWSESETAQPGTRLMLVPAPDKAGTVEIRAKLAPPAITDLTSTNTLPIPQQFVHSIFFPIARKHLSGCPFFLHSSSGEEIQRAYQEAHQLLRKLRPGKNQGVTFRSIN